MRICPVCRAAYDGTERFCTRDSHRLVDEGDFARLGTTIGNYRLLAVEGRGGMGTVYRAEHVYIGKKVAVKILHQRFARHEEAVRRFLREARAASSIAHPNIVDVTDFGPGPDGAVYFVMEFLDGKSLEAVLDKEGRLPLHRAIGIVSQMASALAAAHEKGIVHRDLKPENVMLIARPGRRELIRATGRDASGTLKFVVEKEGDFDFVKILDFGIAKVQEPESAFREAGTRDTTVGSVFGTPEYMAPEQARGQPVDHRADIYALGIMFYDMLTGKVPFRAEAPIDVLHRQIHEMPPPPSTVAPQAEITPAAEHLIMRALEKDPARRQQSMDELRDELMSSWGSVAFRRDAYRVPGAAESGVAPRGRRLTEELDEWLAEHRSALHEASRRLLEIAQAAEQGHGGDFDWDELAATSRNVETTVTIGADGKPVLLTDKKDAR